MKRWTYSVALTALLAATSGLANGQDRDQRSGDHEQHADNREQHSGDREPSSDKGDEAHPSRMPMFRPPGPGGFGRGSMGSQGITDKLDSNHDGRISSEEIDQAIVVLRGMDLNRDGQLTADEFGGFTGRVISRRQLPGIFGDSNGFGNMLGFSLMSEQGPQGPGPDHRGPDANREGQRGPDHFGPDQRGPEARGPQGHPFDVRRDDRHRSHEVRRNRHHREVRSGDRRHDRHDQDRHFKSGRKSDKHVRGAKRGHGRNRERVAGRSSRHDRR
ncbi:MAG: hypothetical protein JNL58_24570 [Planctomyces sp.]|nr:hypothetical protein [Planctomyces sp.]